MPVGQRAHGIEFGEHLAGLRDHGGSERSQLHPARPPHEQLCAQLAFERRNGTRGGGLRESDGYGCIRDRSGVIAGHENAQRADVESHAPSVWQRVLAHYVRRQTRGSLPVWRINPLRSPLSNPLRRPAASPAWR
jgi:hypothetical protein